MVSATGWAILLPAALLAGWIDAVIGGGGLILLPLLMGVAPAMAPATAMGTNKLAACCGTSSAAWKMARAVKLKRKDALQVVPLALVCSGLGAFLAASLSKDVMRPVVIVLMLVAGIWITLRPDFGMHRSKARPRWLALLVAAGIAAYDGLFGPGTGMFFIIAFTALLGEDLLHSAALAKVANTATNVGALVVFALNGHVLWLLGIVLAVANVVGAQFGARTVLGGGAKFLRYALLALVVVMSLVLAHQQWG